jgi:biopolymer transport protein ExbB
MLTHFWSIMHKGGLVMWPLLVLSIISATVSFERAVYWARQNGPAGKRGFAALMDAMRRGDAARSQALADTSETVYARIARALLADGASDAVGVGAVETERIRMDRFMATLSTIITAAPMLGILGTVTGIITSFDLLSGGEAMVATASGLVVALLALFPFMAFGAMRENTLGRLETMIAVAQLSFGTAPRRRVPEERGSKPEVAELAGR